MNVFPPRRRHLRLSTALTTGLTTGLAAAPAAADAGPPDRIKLPRGWQPEGITTDGRSCTPGRWPTAPSCAPTRAPGRRRLLAKGKDGRKAVGVEYDRRRDVLWVAGGETGVIRAQDADTGKVLRTYTLPAASARFVNDLVVTRRAVYATDSEQAELAVVKLQKRHPHRVPPKSALRMLPLTGDLVLADGFDLNGIARFHGRLVAVQSNVGKLFRINGRSGVTREVDLGGATLTNGDGIEPGKRVLYVVQNQLNQVAVLDLNRRVTRGEVDPHHQRPRLRRTDDGGAGPALALPGERPVRHRPDAEHEVLDHPRRRALSARRRSSADIGFTLQGGEFPGHDEDATHTLDGGTGGGPGHDRSRHDARPHAGGRCCPRAAGAGGARRARPVDPTGLRHPDFALRAPTADRLRRRTRAWDRCDRRPRIGRSSVLGRVERHVRHSTAQRPRHQRRPGRRRRGRDRRRPRVSRGPLRAGVRDRAGRPASDPPGPAGARRSHRDRRAVPVRGTGCAGRW